MNKALLVTMFLIFSVAHSQNACVDGAWYLNKLESNDTIVTYGNDPISNSVPSISILEDFLFFTPTTLTFCLYGCHIVDTSFNLDTSQSFSITNHNLNVLQPSSFYECDEDNLINSEFFINNFLFDETTQTWYQSFQFQTLFINGSNNIKITNSDGVTATFNEFVVISVEEFKKPQFIIHPNPVKDEIIISNSSFEIENIQIFNLQGKHIMNNNIDNNIINVSQLTQGIYILQVITDKGKFNKKFIKE